MWTQVFGDQLVGSLTRTLYRPPLLSAFSSTLTPRKGERRGMGIKVEGGLSGRKGSQEQCLPCPETQRQAPGLSLELSADPGRAPQTRLERTGGRAGP